MRKVFTFPVLVVVLLIALGILSGLAVAQNTEGSITKSADTNSPPVALNGNTAVGLGLVITLISAAAGYGSAWSKVSRHCNNKEEHHSLSSLDERYVQKVYLDEKFCGFKELLEAQFKLLKEELKHNDK